MEGLGDELQLKTEHQLHAVLAHHKPEGLMVAWAGEHLSGHLDGYAQRLSSTSGFQGTYFSAVVSQDGVTVPSAETREDISRGPIDHNATAVCSTS